MTSEEILDRIERAHRKAAYELKDYLEELMIQEPEWDTSKKYYLDSFIDAIYVNSEGVKDYDRDALSDLMPCVIKEFSSEGFNRHISDVIRLHKRSVMNKNILRQSAMAILSSKFPAKDIERFSVYAYSDTEICISKITKRSNLWIKLDIMTLLEKVNRASSIKDLFRN
jgi:hypothetical protein